MTIFPPANNGGEGLAAWANVPFLGRIPMMTALEKAAETGVGLVEQGTRDSLVLSQIVNSKERDERIKGRNHVSCGTIDVFKLICLLGRMSDIIFEFETETVPSYQRPEVGEG